MAGGYDYFYTLQEICVLLNLLPNTFRQIVREYGDIVRVREQVRKGRTVLGLPRADFENLRTVMELRARGLSGEEIRKVLRESGSAPLPSGESPTPTAPMPVEEGRDPVEEVSVFTASRLEGEAAGEGEAQDDQGGDDSKDDDSDAGNALSVKPADRIARASFDYRGRFSAGRDQAAASLDSHAPVPRLGGGRVVSVPRPIRAEGMESELLGEIASLREELKKMDAKRQEERDKLMTALMRTQHELQSLRYEVGATLSRRERKKKRKGFWAWLFE